MSTLKVRRGWLVLLIIALLAGLVLQQIMQLVFDTDLRDISLDMAPDAIAIDTASHRAVVSDGHGAVRIIDASNGALKPIVTIPALSALGGQNHVTSVELHAFDEGFAAVDDRSGHAFVSSVTGGPRGRGMMIMSDTRSGHILHAMNVGRGPSNLVVDKLRRRVFAISYYGNVVRAFTTMSGAPLFTVSITSPFFGAVDKSSGHVFVAGQAGLVYMLDGASGAVLRAVSAGTGPLAVNPRTNRVFVVDQRNSGVLTMLDARTGARVGTTTIACRVPAGIAVDERANRVFVACHDSTVSIFDGKNGALYKRIAVDVDPVDLAVDPQSGRAFVIGVYDHPAGADNLFTALLYDLAYHTGHNGGVSVIDTRSGREIRTDRVGQWPAVVAVDSIEGRAFITNSGSHSVTVLSTRAFR